MKRFISVFILVAIVFSNLMPYSIVMAKGEDEKITIEDEQNYTEGYKRYLELSDEEKAKVEVIPNKYKVPLDMIYEDTEIVKEEPSIDNLFGSFASSKIQAKDADKIPSKFNLGDKINILIEDQGSQGNCWNFASLKTLETYLALKGYGEYDLSSKHLDYIESEEFAKLGLAGQGRKLHDGGSFTIQFEDYVNNCLGPVLEEEMPYDKEYLTEEYEKILKIEPKAYVGETITYPSIEKDWYTYTDDELRLFREKIKKHIMENGTLYAVIADPNNHEFLNATTSAEYVPEGYGYLIGQSHAVSIIGWDDNYSKENFNELHRPSKDGAYIALNSWGNNWGDNGLFYISYEDIFVEAYLSGILSASTNKSDVIKQEQTKNIQFKDRNLYNEMKKILVNELIPKNNGKFDDQNMILKLTDNQINSVYELYLPNKGITDLSGIENFRELYTIELANNQISNIDCLTNLEKLSTLDVSNNKISTLPVIGDTEIGDIGKQGKRRMDTLNLSSNPIKDGLSNLKEIYIAELILNDCELTDSHINVLKNMSSEYYGFLEMELQDNNFENVSGLRNISGIYRLDLSRNKNIKIDTIPESVADISLRDCNITNLSALQNENRQIESLDVSANEKLVISTIPKVIYKLGIGNNSLINDDTIDEIINSQKDLQELDLSYTNITDVSKLANMDNLEELNLSGNKNLNNLNKLTQILRLRLQDCGIKEYKDLYKDLSTNTNLIYLDLSHNEIEEIVNDLYDDSEYDSVGSSPKSITDIELEGDDDGYYEKIAVDLAYNKIWDIWDIPYYVFDVTNQKIDINVNIISGEENRFSYIEKLPLYTNKYKETYYCEGCQLDSENGELIIQGNNPSGVAKITIEGGARDGFEYTIKYNVMDKDSIKVHYLDNWNYDYKDLYVAGENFDPTGLEIVAEYENGITKKIKDYEIVDGNNLKNGQEAVKIKYKDKELEIYVHVIDEKETEKIDLSEMNTVLFNEVLENLNPLKANVETKEITVSKEYHSYLYLDNDEITDLTGISKLYFLKEISIFGGKYTDVSELGKLADLESVSIENNNNLTNINGLENCNKLKSLYINGNKINDISKLVNEGTINNLEVVNLQSTINVEQLQEKDGKIVLPKYIKTLKEKGNVINAYTKYVLKDEKYVNSAKKEECEIEQSGDDLVVKLDKELSKDKKATNRYIGIEIDGHFGEKFDKYAKVSLNINYTVPNKWEKIEVTESPDKSSYIEGEIFDKTGMIVSKVMADGTKEEITEYAINAKNPLTVNDGVITISYTEKGETKTTYLNINIHKQNEEQKTEHIILDGEKYIKISRTNNTVADITTSANFANAQGYRATNKDGKQLEVGDKLGTGSKIEIFNSSNQSIGMYTVVTKGDLNGDGKISLVDIAKAELGYIGNIDLENEYLLAADVNSDGKHSLTDVTRMEICLVGLIEI